MDACVHDGSGSNNGEAIMRDQATQTCAQLYGVSKCFGAVQAVDHLDLDIAAGELLALLGPNGAGKTTTIQLLLGLLAADQGKVRVFGAPPQSRAARIRVGVMLQVSQVPPNLRCAEHLDLFRAYYPDPLPVRELVALAGLEGLLQRRSGGLSGGETQRLMFALALAGNPDLLFLDEPTEGLDVLARRRFWEAVRALRQSGKSIVLTTHRIEEAEAVADRVVVMNRGRLIADGTPREIKARFQRKTIRCRTRLSAAELARLPAVIEVAGDGELYRLQSGQAEQTLAALMARDPELAELEVHGAGLEEAFLAMTEDTTMENAA